MFYCNHKWKRVDAREEVCEKCNKTHILPCKHEWVEKDRYEVLSTITNCIIGFKFLLRCKYCGELKTQEVEV